MLKRKIYNELVSWKKNNGATAMMIDGARRVGKSYIAEEFAKSEYKSYILIDFGKAPERMFLIYLSMTVPILICSLQNLRHFILPLCINANR